MELSKQERLILINQYKILNFLNPENEGDYEKQIEILEYGYTFFYPDIEDEMTDNECHFVTDILTLYRLIEAYKRDNPQDKDITDHYWSHFKGFDGGDEISYMILAKFIINKQNKFSEQKKYEEETDNFNSHMRTLDKYGAMLSKWEELERNPEISKEDILTILQAE